ncbi:hypothetical protein HDU76_007269, partial [Blyttiomyces sp. JEL0837]
MSVSSYGGFHRRIADVYIRYDCGEKFFSEEMPSGLDGLLGQQIFMSRMNSLNKGLLKFKSLKDYTPVFRLVGLMVAFSAAVLLISLNNFSSNVYVYFLLVAVCGAIVVAITRFTARSKQETFFERRLARWNHQDKRIRLVWDIRKANESVPLSAFLTGLQIRWCVSIHFVDLTFFEDDGSGEFYGYGVGAEGAMGYREDEIEFLPAYEPGPTRVVNDDEDEDLESGTGGNVMTTIATPQRLVTLGNDGNVIAAQPLRRFSGTDIDTITTTTTAGQFENNQIPTILVPPQPLQTTATTLSASQGQYFPRLNPASNNNHGGSDLNLTVPTNNNIHLQQRNGDSLDFGIHTPTSPRPPSYKTYETAAERRDNVLRRARRSWRASVRGGINLGGIRVGRVGNSGVGVGSNVGGGGGSDVTDATQGQGDVQGYGQGQEEHGTGGRSLTANVDL